jgi:dolichol-phosphate mannosyltransferase
MGLYIGRIHAEVKRRPLYVVTTRVGFDSPASAETIQWDKVREVRTAV